MARYMHPLRHEDDPDRGRLVNLHAFTDLAVTTHASHPEVLSVVGYLPALYVEPGKGNGIVVGTGYPDVVTATAALRRVAIIANGGDGTIGTVPGPAS